MAGIWRFGGQTLLVMSLVSVDVIALGNTDKCVDDIWMEFKTG